MAEKKDYYEVLGDSKSATDEEIKKAYRSLDEAMLEGLQFTVIENVKKGFPIHEDSVKAYNFIAISYERKKL